MLFPLPQLLSLTLPLASSSLSPVLSLHTTFFWSLSWFLCVKLISNNSVILLSSSSVFPSQCKFFLPFYLIPFVYFPHWHVRTLKPQTLPICSPPYSGAWHGACYVADTWERLIDTYFSSEPTWRLHFRYKPVPSEHYTRNRLPTSIWQTLEALFKIIVCMGNVNFKNFLRWLNMNINKWHQNFLQILSPGGANSARSTLLFYCD